MRHRIGFIPIKFLFLVGWISLGLGLMANSTQATQFKVRGVADALLLQKKVSIPSNSGSRLGKLSHDLLSRALSRGELNSYTGSEGGVTEINALGSAMEVSPTQEVRAYGWCYRVDGKIPEELADEYALSGLEKNIEWFYAYALYQEGRWTRMCIPAERKSSS